ncbi:hypothetical protein AX16_009296 [Volvariella volvacea WC 439]|nr:hypothetical protein AX16_009296 [Volvariella volvacea WC 439]
MPTAWSTISIQSPKSPGLVQLVELSLIRTGDTCPLNLSISQYGTSPSSQEIELVVEILNLYISYADRWHTIHINVGSKVGAGRVSSLPIPRNLVFVQGITLNEWKQAAQDQIWEAINSSPRLRRARWENVIPKSTPWSQLEQVDIMVNLIQPLGDVLPRLTNLTSLNMRCGGFTGLVPQAFTTKLISIPALQVLHLTGFHIYPILDRLVTPRLRELSIHPNYVRETHTDPFPSIHAFLTHSNCHLVKLKNSDPNIDSNSTLAFLRQSLAANTLDDLRTFNLHGSPSAPDEVARLLTIPIPDEEGQGLQSISQMIFLLFLQYLSWNSWAPNTAGLLGAMLKSR